MKKKERESAKNGAALSGQSDLPECRAVAVEAVQSRGKLDGNMARRKLYGDHVVWDESLTGFGLRVRASGHKAWIVKFAERGQSQFVTLGAVEALNARTARARARTLIEQAMLDGLPTRRGDGKGRAVPLFRDYVAEFWGDYAHHWKPATRRTNQAMIRRELMPAFGDTGLDALARADVMRWRDDMAGRTGVFNRALPVLAVMLGYAEQLAYRRKGSNPAKGVARYKRKLPERYLSDAEYRRLARAMDTIGLESPYAVPAIKLLMFTGARSGEITGLRWEWVQPPRLMLPDSKTGPKTIWLNSPALAVLDSLPERHSHGFVFPAKKGDVPIKIDNYWVALRRRAALPDVRLHDLRHSFASVAITDGMPLGTIGKLLGHALLETTARYAHLADEVVAEAAVRVSGGIAAALGIGT